MVVYNYYHFTNYNGNNLLYRTRKGIVQGWNGAFWIPVAQKTVRQLRSRMRQQGLLGNRMNKKAVAEIFGKEMIKPGNDIQSIMRNARRQHK